MLHPSAAAACAGSQPAPAACACRAVTIAAAAQQTTCTQVQSNHSMHHPMAHAVIHLSPPSPAGAARSPTPSLSLSPSHSINPSSLTHLRVPTSSLSSMRTRLSSISNTLGSSPNRKDASNSAGRGEGKRGGGGVIVSVGRCVGCLLLKSCSPFTAHSLATTQY